MAETWTQWPLALEASKAGLSPRIRRRWHRSMGLEERRLQGGMWRHMRHRNIYYIGMRSSRELVGMGMEKKLPHKFL